MVQPDTKDGGLRDLSLEGAGGASGAAQLLGLLRTAYVTRRSGHLHLTHGRERRGLAIREGHIVQGRSDVAGEHLGDVLVRHGLVSQEDLDRAVAEVLAQRRPLGAVLAGLSLVDGAHLEEAVGWHVREILFAALDRPGGTVAFEELESDSAGLPERRIRVRALHRPDPARGGAAADGSRGGARGPGGSRPQAGPRRRSAAASAPGRPHPDRRVRALAHRRDVERARDRRPDAPPVRGDRAQPPGPPLHGRHRRCAGPPGRPPCPRAAACPGAPAARGQSGATLRPRPDPRRRRPHLRRPRLPHQPRLRPMPFPAPVRLWAPRRSEG